MEKRFLGVQEGVLGVDAAVVRVVGFAGGFEFGGVEDGRGEEGGGVFGNLGGEAAEVAVEVGEFGDDGVGGGGVGVEEEGCVDVHGVWDKDENRWVGVQGRVFVGDVAVHTWFEIGF